MKVNMHEFITIKEAKINDFYDIKEKIGEGAFGQVYRVNCKQTGEERAIKVIKRKLMNSDKTNQFLAETSLLKKISHPSIIKVYDLYSYDNNYYVVMEYCKGGAITNYTKKIRFNEETIVLNIMKQLLGSLSYLHSLEIVHRDIKIDNLVFLNEVTTENILDYMPVKIIDFGTSVKMKFKIQNSYPMAGTISYMAPEVLKGVLTEKSDIWSSAIVMIRLLTGKNPFNGTD